MTCRYDREQDAYLADGEPCKRDTYGDPTYHCTARRTCSQHVGKGELTCARCLGRTRIDIRQIALLSTLMLPMAIGDGANSQAADLAGPAADPRSVAAIRLYVQGHATHLYRTEKITEATFDKILGTLPDEDEWHPYSVTTRWQMMLSEDYRHPLPGRLTITTATAYLERHLNKTAQDPEQDFPLMARELRKVRSRLETALHNSTEPERGAPCPECTSAGNVDPKDVRLIREYGHWCDVEDCERIHYSDDSGDEWYCPRKRTEHRWSHAWYTGYIEEREQTA